MADTKLSQIASGGAVNTSTDTAVVVRSGSSDVLVSLSALVPSFNNITSGTNTTAAMVVGTGGSIAATGSGTVTATAAPASGITGTTLASNVVTSSLTTVGTLGSLSVTGNITNATLTASSAVATDGSKNLVSVTNTGTGNNVLATSPTLVTPALGTPSSGTLTSCTGLPMSGLVSGTLGSGVGASATAYSGGTVSSGTYTPAASNGNFQYITANGAFTLAVPSSVCTIILEVTNGASAGAITTSSYTKVTGDTYNTTNANKFLFYITVSQTYSNLNVLALQ